MEFVSSLADAVKVPSCGALVSLWIGAVLNLKLHRHDDSLSAVCVSACALHASVQVQSCAYVLIYLHAYTHAWTYVAHTHAHTHIHTQRHTHTHACTCTQAHIV